MQALAGKIRYTSLIDVRCHGREDFGSSTVCHDAEDGCEHYRKCRDYRHPDCHRPEGEQDGNGNHGENRRDKSKKYACHELDFSVE
jgi:hypothetical protein